MEEAPKEKWAMPSLAGIKSRCRESVIPLCAYLAIALVLFWPATIDLTNTIVGSSGDLYQNIWNLWLVSYSVFTLHASPYFTNMLFYPIGASLVTHTLSPLASLLTFPLQAISLALCYNSVFFIGFMLSGFFMYLLAEHVVKNKHAAFVAGIIFEFSQFHMAHALFGQLNWVSIEFFPLFVLLLLLMIERRKLIYSVGAAASFILLLFVGDPEQGIITVLFALLLLAFYCVGQRRNEILNREFLLQLLGMGALALLIGLPFLIPIVNGILHGVLNQATFQLSGIKQNMAQSPPLLAFLLPSPYNNLFSWASDSYYSIYAINTVERTAYIGYTVIALALLGVALGKDRIRDRLLWVLAAALFAIMAIGPYLQIGQLVYPPHSAIPGPFLIYRQIPILSIIKEPARFQLVTTLSLALLAAFGFKEVLELKKLEGRKAYYVTAAIVLLILAECGGIPFQSSFIGSYFTTLQMPSSYHQLAKVPGDFGVLVLPSIPVNTIHPYVYLGLAMYYQTAFAKPILDGYTSRENFTDLGVSLRIPLSQQATSLANGAGLAPSSPIAINASNVTLYWLAKSNTRYVSVINGAYTSDELATLTGYLTSLFGPAAYSDNMTSTYFTGNAIQKANRSIVAYTSGGTWTHGCSGLSFCGPSNSAFGTLWWGANARAINVSAPAGDTGYILKFTVAPSQPNMNFSVIFNSKVIGYTVLSEGLSNYKLNLTLNPGMNRVTFFASGPPQQKINPTAPEFGIRNITFQKR